MRAAVLYGNDDLRIEDVAIPVLAEDDVLIQVSYNGLCGTDATEFSKGPMMVPLDKPHPNSKHVGPTILGHEFVGLVVEAGANAKDLIGVRVACGAGVSCGNCKMCKAGRTNLCDSYYTLGLSTHGGLAEYVRAPKNICVPIPDDCSDLDAVLAQPLAVAIHAVRRANISPGDRVVLLGVGAIGTFICIALQEYDVDVIAIDIEQSRLDAAKTFGADQAILIDPQLSSEELAASLGIAADIVFETSGAKGAPTRAKSLVRNGGMIMLLGLNKTPQEFVFSDAVLREVTLETSAAHVCATDIPAALALLKSGAIAPLLIERVLDLEDSLEAFIALSSGRALGKFVVCPSRKHVGVLRGAEAGLL